jgi:hypothetical protein
MLPEDRLFIGLARFRSGFVSPLSGDGGDKRSDVDADRVVQRLRQRRQRSPETDLSDQRWARK